MRVMQRSYWFFGLKVIAFVVKIVCEVSSFTVGQSLSFPLLSFQLTFVISTKKFCSFRTENDSNNEIMKVIH